MPFNPYFFLMFIIIIATYIRYVYRESKEKGVTVLLLVTFKEGIEVPDFQRNRKMREFNLSEDKISIYDPAGFYWGSYVAKNIRL
jgi:hypothetical protein